MKKAFQLSLIISVIFLNGCVTGTRNIAIDTPASTVAELSKGSIYISSVNDLRTFEQKPKSPRTPSVKGKLTNTTKEDRAKLVGRQRNGYGMAMGSVALEEDRTVHMETRELLAVALNHRGYSISDSEEGAIKLSADIEKFWAWFVPGFTSIGFESELAIKLNANNKSALVTGSGENRGQIASNANWALTYKRAYQEFLENIDQALIDLGL